MKKWPLILVAAMVLFLLVLPWAIEKSINYVLMNKLDGYWGKIADIDIPFKRWGYIIQGLEVYKEGVDETPLLTVDKIDVALLIKPLFNGQLLTDILIETPKLKIIQDVKEPAEKINIEKLLSEWDSLLDGLIPVQIRRFDLRDGKIEMTDTVLDGTLAVVIDKIDFFLEDLSLYSTSSMSPIHVMARIQQHAIFQLDGRINIADEYVLADVDFQMESLKIDSLNKTLRKYVPVDITRGDLRFYGELAVQGVDRSDGYVKVFLDDIDIIATNQHYQGPKHVLIEFGSAFFSWVVKNNDQKTVATEIPFKLTNKKLEIDTSTAFWSTLKNMVGELRPGIENRLSLENTGLSE